MADPARPEQRLIAAAASYVLRWPHDAIERQTLREIMSDAIARSGTQNSPPLERVIAAAQTVIARGDRGDSTELRLALGTFFYRRIAGQAPGRSGA